MNRNRLLLLLLSAVAVLSACKSNPTGPTVTEVTVTPPSAVITVGGTQQFSAAAKDAGGTAVSGVTVTWASSDTQVATVSDAGLVTAMAAGQAAITATISGVAGSAAVTVSTPGQLCDNPKTVSLAVGGSATYDLADCILLPSGASGDRYRVGVTWPTQAEVASDVHQVTLSVTGLGVVASPPALAPSPEPMAPIPGFSDPTFLKELRMSEATERFHATMREREAEMVDRIGTRGLLASRRDDHLHRAPAAASPAKITLDTVTASCTTSPAAKATALLVQENDDMVVYQDSAQWADPNTRIPEALAQKMTDYYSAYAKDMVDAYWGKPSDIDGNGKIIMFVSPVASDSIAAFVWAGDFFDNNIPESQGGCPASNQAELIYFNAGLILDMQASSPGYQALSTVAHEMRHVVSLYDRIAASNRTGTNQFHPTWIEEGAAEISGEMSSRIAWAANGGPAAVAAVTRTSFQDAGGFTEENYGAALNLARTVWFLSSQPNGLTVTPDGAADGSSVYGSGWLFHRWLGDAYGNTSRTALGDSAFFHALTDSLAPGGVNGIVAQTGKSFDTLLAEFYSTIMLHQTGAPTPPRQFLRYDFVSATSVFSNPNPPGDFPWPITLNGGEVPTVSFKTAEYQGPIGASGVRIHDFLSNGTGAGAQIRVNMPSPGQIVVVRLR